MNDSLIAKYLSDDSVSEIMINGLNGIYVEREGKIEKVKESYPSEKEIFELIDKILIPLEKKITKNSPYADARLSDGSRVNIVIPPVSLTGPMVTIRKFNKARSSPERLVECGSLNRSMLSFLELSAKSKKNIVIFGGTGSGKTTLLNAVSSYIPERERIVSIEDTAELNLQQEHVGRLEAKAPDADGKGEVTVRQLLKNALRMRPDRIIIGECRGAEALDMLQAMNTGHSGSMTTVHANSARDCLKRLEVMVLMAGYDLPLRAIREQIASAIDLLVQVARFHDGTRKITGITEITGLEGDVVTLSPIFEFKQSGVGKSTGKVEGSFKATGNIPVFIEELKKHGQEIEMGMFK
ncbi:MAG: CpaF family protein [Endomicrobiales bacterium]|nr:CpaF family protein [Endomicrobiales bacterium]